MESISHAMNNSLTDFFIKIGYLADKLYISFLSMRYYFNNCIFNRAHLSDKAWRLSNIDLRSTIATLPMLSILQRYPLEYKRSHGGWEEVRFIGHIQSCEKIHATTKTNNGKAETKHSNRNHTLLKLAKYFIQWYFNLLPGVTSDHSETLSPFSRNYNSVDILRQSQTLGTGVNTKTLFNDDDVMNPSSNDEAEEEDNSPRIVIGDYTLEEREKMVKDLFKNNPDYPHFQYSTSES